MTNNRFYPMFAAIMLSSLFSIHAAQAGEGRAQLDRYLKDFITLQASFEQTLMDEKGRTLELSQGTVYLWRPSRFRWDYETPYEQSIVANGEKIWIYDKDLDQITVKPFQAALGNTPALLLNTKVDIDKEFVVSEIGEVDGMVWIALKPDGNEKQYTDIRLGFKDSALGVMELVDNFGQTTRIRFSREQRNAKLDPSLFMFTPPPGVDILDPTNSP